MGSRRKRRSKEGVGKFKRVEAGSLEAEEGRDKNFFVLDIIDKMAENKDLGYCVAEEIGRE